MNFGYKYKGASKERLLLSKSIKGNVARDCSHWIAPEGEVQARHLMRVSKGTAQFGYVER